MRVNGKGSCTNDWWDCGKEGRCIGLEFVIVGFLTCWCCVGVLADCEVGVMMWCDMDCGFCVVRVAE